MITVVIVADDRSKKGIGRKHPGSDEKNHQQGAQRARIGQQSQHTAKSHALADNLVRHAPENQQGRHHARQTDAHEEITCAPYMSKPGGDWHARQSRDAQPEQYDGDGAALLIPLDKVRPERTKHRANETGADPHQYTRGQQHFVAGCERKEHGRCAEQPKPEQHLPLARQVAQRDLQQRRCERERHAENGNQVGALRGAQRPFT